MHSGFFNIWKNVQDDVIKGLRDVGCTQDGKDDLIYVTGHSLGAALTHLAMFALDSAGFHIAKTYSFEAPRVGNQAFADAFAVAFSRQIPVFRITHHYDPAVHVPPMAFGYRHVEKEVYYDGEGAYRVCEQMEDPACANQFWNLPSLLLFHTDDHCKSPLLPNGDFCWPIGCDAPKSTLIV